jgi:uncharacterized membrane protein
MRIFTSLFRNWAALTAALAIVLLLAVSGPATAHGKKKHHPQTEQVQPPRPQQQQTSTGGATTEAHGGNQSVQQQAGEMMDDMDMEMDRSKMSFAERLVAWFGHLHPAIVHFPIAFFPAAWFTAIVGRRRPAFSAPVQFLVVAGGIFAPIAAIAGWITAADADPSNILTYHRWLGTGVGLAGLLLGIWAWRRPWEDRGAGMIMALTAMTVAIIVQAGLGAIVTHGMEHLMF